MLNIHYMSTNFLVKAGSKAKIINYEAIPIETSEDEEDEIRVRKSCAKRILFPATRDKYDNVIPPKWSEISIQNPQFGDIVAGTGEDIVDCESVFVVGPDNKLIFIGEDIDYAAVPAIVTSRLITPVDFYANISEDIYLFIELVPFHYQQGYVMLHNCKHFVPDELEYLDDPSASVYFDYEEGKIKVL
jgi:hypothetical protein